ncbi:MAG: lamin tail domain-containing protein, partial [Butyricicoccus sp.]|nr:lamin tail domain-containing protein [Butyricicoccus sp.]
VIINQVYGGGGKSDTPFSHSFIELYNPTEKEVELSGYQLNYSSNRDQSKKEHAGSTTPVDGETQIVTLDLNGSIPAHTSFLVRCAEETTEIAKYTLNGYDQTWDQVIDNDQTVVLTLTKGDIYVDGVSTRTDGALTEEGGTLATDDISKQKSVRRIDFADTDNNSADFELLEWKDASDGFLAENRPRSLSDGAWPEVEENTGFSADSLTLQPGETASTIRLNWYAPAGTTAAQVNFGGEIVQAEVCALHTPTTVDENKYTDTGKMVCKAAVEGLEPGKTYTYRLSNDGGETWSVPYHYTTPAADSFTFAFTSDPQIKESGEQNGKKPDGVDGGWDPDPANNQTGWAKMMEVIGQKNATLVVSAGDQVEDQSWGKSSEYAAFFAPEEMTSIAYAPAVGNHDRHYMFADHFNLPNEMAIAEDGTEGGENELTQVQTSFCAQNNGDSSSHGNHIEKNGNVEDYPERREMETLGNYYYLYNNVLFITLNTGAYPGGNDPESEGVTNATAAMKDNAEAEAMVENFRKTIDAAKADYDGEYDWIVVTHHKSTQTVAKHAADSDIENYVDAGFEQLMAEEDVDFVLGGHDHVYSRSYVLDGSGDRAAERLDTIHDPDGVIYITGNCCSDMQYYTPFQTLDKTNNADYPRLANGQTGSQAYLEGAGKTGAEQAGYLPIGNQEWNQEYSPSYVLFTVEGNTITAKAYNLDGDSDAPDSKEIDAFTVTKNTDGGAKAKGFENSGAALALTQVGRYDSGMTNADGGVMEIVDYNHENGWAYAVNGQAGVLTAIPLDADKSKLTAGERVDLLDGYNIDVKALVEDDTFAYGDMTSVAVSPDGKMLAAAIQAENYTANGRAALFTCNADGTLTFVRTVETGVQPDMVTFTPDGTRILTANEGEPREGYSASDAIDPAGSVTVIQVEDWTANTIGFEKFEHDTLAQAGIVLKKDTAPSVDLEPEYIACNNQTAYVSCQEANAIAVLDLDTGAFTGIYSVGFTDYSETAIDLGNGDDAYAPQTYENLKGIRMPDSIALYTVNGTDYLLTANEGDSRAWPVETEADVNEIKNKKSPNGKTFEKKITWFDASQYDGLESGVDYLFGGR